MDFVKLMIPSVVCTLRYDVWYDIYIESSNHQDSGMIFTVWMNEWMNEW